jgi:putative cardiolipin synthase
MRARLLAAVVVLCLSACAVAPPPPKPPPGYASAPADGGALAAVERAVQGLQGHDASGFRLLSANADALDWRLALVDAAEHALDLQYYVWFGDTVGQLLMSRVIAAADRGVRVRILFDDLNTLLHDMSHVELRDRALARLDEHPRIEIRVFNAWRERGLLGRLVETAGDFNRLNRRMHNKQMVADNRVAIIGGRNIGDEYFGLNREFNFHDLDVLGVGPVARQASAVFDRYWNSDWVRRIPSRAAGSPRSGGTDPAQSLERSARSGATGPALASPRRGVEGLAASLVVGHSSVHTDSPSRAADAVNHMPEAFRSLMLSARREVLITNAYVIPDARFIQDLRDLVARGVRVRLLTNSLASHDVAAVNSHYEGWRRAIVGSGAQLHEWRPDAAAKDALVDTAPVRSRFAGLHTKAMVVDRERSFVGSMNLDPRSEVINAEMGVLIDSVPLAQKLAHRMEADMEGANSWAVQADAAGGLRWISDKGTLETQPARSVWQHLQNAFFKLFPPSLY